MRIFIGFLCSLNICLSFLSCTSNNPKTTNDEIDSFLIVKMYNDSIIQTRIYETVGFQYNLISKGDTFVDKVNMGILDVQAAKLMARTGGACSKEWEMNKYEHNWYVLNKECKYMKFCRKNNERLDYCTYIVPHYAYKRGKIYKITEHYQLSNHKESWYPDNVEKDSMCFFYNDTLYPKQLYIIGEESYITPQFREIMNELNL